jgi:hypothetical protein
MGIKTLCSFLYEHCGEVMTSQKRARTHTTHYNHPSTNRTNRTYTNRTNSTYNNRTNSTYNNRTNVDLDGGPSSLGWGRLKQGNVVQDVCHYQSPVMKSGITSISLQSLVGKTVVIDTSIYLYKFAGNDSLIPSMYMFITLLRECQITPIFIFDGRPSDAKYEEVKRRREVKRIALEKFYAMRQDKSVDPLSLSRVRKQCVYLNKNHTNKVKELMTACGVIYYDAITESDPLCAYLVQTGKAWACMSDDMDMMAFGCPRVIRHTNILNGTATLFDLDVILERLNATLCDFRQAALLCEHDQHTIGTLPWKSMQEVWHLVSKYYQQSTGTPRHTISNNPRYNTISNNPRYDTISSNPRYDTISSNPRYDTISEKLSIYDWLLDTGKIHPDQHQTLYQTYKSMCIESAEFQTNVQVELATRYGDHAAPLLIQPQWVVVSSPVKDKEVDLITWEESVIIWEDLEPEPEPEPESTTPTPPLPIAEPTVIVPVQSTFRGTYDRERVKAVMQEFGVELDA